MQTTEIRGFNYDQASASLFPFKTGSKVGYIDQEGKTVIQPQFEAAFFFYEELANVQLEKDGKWGYIDRTGKFAIDPRFSEAGRFSEGLAAVKLDEKAGFIDSTGKLIINLKGSGDVSLDSVFSDGLAAVKMGEKYGYINKSGETVISPKFDTASPFFGRIAVVSIDKKHGFIETSGKFVIDPQFDDAQPFSNNLAAIKIGEKCGYIDKTGKIVISPKFDSALPFSTEGLAKVVADKKVGFINRSGSYEINLQFEQGDSFWSFERFNSWRGAVIITSDIGLLSFSDGLAAVKDANGNSGYINQKGQFIIQPQFKEASPFYHGLAAVSTTKGFDEVSLINKNGNFVWHSAKGGSQPSSTGLDNNSSSSARTGKLVTDTNIRREPNKDSMKIGIHFRDAKVRILDETRYLRDGKVVTWYKVQVYEYGRSVYPQNTGGKNSPFDADEGWVNAEFVVPN